MGLRVLKSFLISCELVHVVWYEKFWASSFFSIRVYSVELMDIWRCNSPIKSSHNNIVQVWYKRKWFCGIIHQHIIECVHCTHCTALSVFLYCINKVYILIAIYLDSIVQEGSEGTHDVDKCMSVSTFQKVNKVAQDKCDYSIFYYTLLFLQNCILNCNFIVAWYSVIV